MGKVLNNFDNKMNQAIIEECSSIKKKMESEMNLLSSDEKNTSVDISVVKQLLISKNDVIYIGNMYGIEWDTAFDKNRDSVLKKAGNLDGFGEVYGFQPEGMLFKRSHGTLFTSAGIIHIPMFGDIQRLTYADLCFSTISRSTNLGARSISVSFGDITYINAGNISYEQLWRIRGIILQKIKEAQIIFYQKYCQLLDRIASLSSVQQYDDAQKILHIISACINRTPFEMYSAPELKSAVLEAMHQFKEAASIPGLTPERIEQISIHEKEYKIVLHQNDIEEAQTYYSQREYEKSLISISKGLQTASEKILWQLLENIVNEYASINNGYLFEQLEKILFSAQGSEEYRALLFNKASNICRSEALNEYDQQNYQKCLHTIRYAMNKVFDVQNWEIVNKIAENTDLDDISFIDELVNTTNSFQGVFDCSNVEDILFERFWTKAEESYVSMNYVSSIVLLSNAMHYKNDSKIFDLLSKIIAEHDSAETESLFSLINEKILISNISDSERKFLAEKMTKRLLSVAKENLDKNDYSEALKHIRIAADSCRTTECYQLYALIVEAYASEENSYLNSDVNKILEYANTTVFPAEIDNMLKNLNNQYQSAAFKNVCEKLKYGYDIEAIDSFDCLKQTDEYGMTVAMYAALYKNTEAIKYIAKKYGNPAEYEQKNILGLDFGTIICYSYSNVPDSILELFSWYVDAKKEMDDTDEWLHKRNKELDTQLNRLKLELSKARWQKNYQLLEECQDAASKIHDAKDELVNIWENSDVKLNQENDRWYTTGYQKSWNAILAYLVMDFKEVIDSNNKCIEDLALNKFTDEYLQQNLTEKGEFETTKAYQQRTEEMKNAAKMKFESNKSSLIESFITKTNAESKEYNLPIELARLFISSKLDNPVKLEKYDADKQEFAIVWDGFTIKNCNQLRMPINVAPDFKQSLPNGEFAIIPKSYRIEARKEGGITLLIKCSIEFRGKEYCYELCQFI